MSRWGVVRVAAIASPLLLAATDTVLAPGLWEVRNTPGVATLDGKILDDLPLGEARTQQICLAATQAADPIAFFARDTSQDCKITSGSAAAGKVDIKGSCPDPDAGTVGTMSLAGNYASDRYELDFATTAEDFQGVMTFSGKLNGRRIGACPSVN